MRTFRLALDDLVETAKFHVLAQVLIQALDELVEPNLADHWLALGVLFCRKQVAQGGCAFGRLHNGTRELPVQRAERRCATHTGLGHGPRLLRCAVCRDILASRAFTESKLI